MINFFTPRSLTRFVCIALFIFSCSAPLNNLFAGDSTRPRGLKPEGKISGIVTDDKGLPVVGATISLKGTTIVTTSNEYGKFSIQLPGVGAVLIISSVGLITREVEVNGKAVLNIILLADITTLNSVVVVGFGTQKKVNLTGSVSSITSKELTARPVGQTSAALQGLLPGVTVTQSSGRPGGDQGTIRIRGIGTLSDPNPLVLIDGIEGSMNTIEANMIESISILKDAASASIYGSRAANGVILITTKRAKGTKLSVNYNSYLAWQSPTNLPDIVNAMDHMVLTNLAYTNTGRAPLYSNDLLEKYRTESAANPDLYPDTDWQKQVLTGSGLMQSHFISLNGGGEKIRFLTSIGYLDQKGIIETSGFKRFTLRNNADIKFSDKLNLKFDLQFVSESVREPADGTALIFHWMNRIPANQAGIYMNGNWGEGWNGVNPIAVTRVGGMIKNTLPSGQLNVSLSYRPVKWLTAELTAAPRFAQNTGDNFSRAIQTYKYDGTAAVISPALSSLNRATSQSFYNNFRGTLTFNKSLKGHNIKVLTGASREDSRNENFSAYRESFILPDYPILNTGSASTQLNTGSASDWALQSFFGRVNYDFKEKYLLEINGRYDGSSRFARGNKYGYFPSLSAGWRVSEEKFFEPLKPVITLLKFRGSWGILGNQNIGNYPFTSSIVSGSYAFGNRIVNVAALNTLANEAISWETTEMRNMGLDITFFRNLSITGDVYFRESRDILYELDIPLIVGLARPPQNVGIVHNKGWELGLNYRGRIRDFSFDLNMNVSDVRNKVIDLRGVNRSALTVSREGYSINSIFGLQADGIFQTAEEVAKHAKQFGIIKPGDIRYVDQDKDGMINDADNVVIGSTIPRYTVGTTLGVSYKGINLSMFFQGVGKANGYLYNQGIMPFFNGGSVQEQHKDNWTPDNRDAKFPRLAFSETNNEKHSSFWLKDASYIRLKNLQLGYNLQPNLLEKTGIKSLRFYIAGQNLFTLDNFWKGYDVEAPVGTGNVYPQVKMYTAGLDLNF